MAQRVIFLCEMCLEEDNEVDAKPVLLRVQDEQAIVDLCPNHEADFIAPVAEMIARHGRPDSSAKPVKKQAISHNYVTPAERRKTNAAPSDPQGPGRYPCPACLNRSPYTTLTGLHYHLNRDHDVPHGDYMRMVTGRCRGCGETHPTPQGFARHVKQVHGFNNAAELSADLARTKPEAIADVVNVLIRGRARVDARRAGGQTLLDTDREPTDGQA